MGGFVPAAALSALQIGISTAQQERRADAANAAARADARAKVAQLQLAEAADERERKARLQRALATQRARLGAQGLGASGSTDAVLAGLTKESSLSGLDQRRLSNLRIDQINDQASSQRRNNLLDLADARTTSVLRLGKVLSRANILDLS
ncbi:MAG: hypothetical protein MUD06_00505 [Rhodospirillales bacterium]|jgi:hypothetical protein|nr:hypothetical protein [Rhodospirillales bacterium]